MGHQVYMKKAELIKKTVFPPLPEKIEYAGRPSLYSKRKTNEKLRKYIRKCIEKRVPPFLEEFALSLGVSASTLKDWAKDETKPEFAEMYEILLTVQKLDLKRRSLSGEYMSPIAKLLLSAEHNVVEKIKQEVTGEDGKPVEVQQVIPPEDRKTYGKLIKNIFEKIYSKPNGQQ